MTYCTPLRQVAERSHGRFCRCFLGPRGTHPAGAHGATRGERDPQQRFCKLSRGRLHPLDDGAAAGRGLRRGTEPPHPQERQRPMSGTLPSTTHIPQPRPLPLPTAELPAPNRPPGGLRPHTAHLRLTRRPPKVKNDHRSRLPCAGVWGEPPLLPPR